MKRGKRELNILILSWRDIKHPSAGGAEIATFEHAKAWVRAGHKVYIFSSHFKQGSRQESVDGVKFIRYGFQYLGVHIAAFFWYLFGKHPRFDLVVDQFHGIPFFTPLYVRAKKLAFIHEVAGEVWWLNPWPKPFNLIPALLGPVFEPLILRLFYRKTPFMTVSASTRNDLISLGISKENISVIYNGVDLSSLPKRLPKKERRQTAIFLGAIAKDKGFEDALKAFAEIKKRDKGWQFWMVGKASPDMVEQVKRLSESLGLGKNFKFWGYVSDKRKFELLSRACVLINPSHHEGWGLVNIEANAAGTPVVAYDVPGCRDSVKNGKTGFLVKKNDTNALAERIISLCRDEHLYNRMLKEAREFSKSFSWDKAGKESLKLIENL